TVGKERGKPAPPAMLDGEEDEGAGHATGDDRIAEEGTQGAPRLERAGQERPEESPQDARQEPADRRDAGERVRQEQGPPANELAGRRGKVAPLRPVRERRRPAAAEDIADREQEAERDDRVDDLREADARNLARPVVDEAEVEEGDDAAEQVADPQDRHT